MFELQDTVESALVLPEVLRRLDHASQQHRQLPFTTLTYAQSIDGSISSDQRRPLQISNEHSRSLTHQLRSVHDAILVGIDTVLIDNPLLTVRLVEGKNPQPVILDSRLRFPLDSRLFNASCVSPIIATRPNACPLTRQRLTAAGAQVVEVPERQPGRLDLLWLLGWLKDQGYASLMVEGGARVITNCLEHSLADQLVVTISPRFLGGWRAIAPCEEHHSRELACLTNVHFENMHGDLIIRGDFPPSN